MVMGALPRDVRIKKAGRPMSITESERHQNTGREASKQHRWKKIEIGRKLIAKSWDFQGMIKNTSKHTLAASSCNRVRNVDVTDEVPAGLTLDFRDGRV